MAADTSFNQGFSITRSDFVGNFGLGFVSLSYELNESTQAFHTTRTHPNVLQEVLLVFCSDTYDIYMNALLDSSSIHFNILNIQIIL